MATPSKGIDRRVQRTRQLLRQAFIEVAEEKGGMAAVSIQDITERANVHRGTFYAHFADKYALVYVLIREEFQKRLTYQIPPVTEWDKGTLHLLIQRTLENFKSVRYQCYLSAIVRPLLEQAIQEELTTLFVQWLEQKGSEKELRHRQIPVKTVAQLMSWTIFGAAVQWSQEDSVLSAKQMADHVLLLITEGVGRMVSGVLAE